MRRGTGGAARRALDALGLSGALLAGADPGDLPALGDLLVDEGAAGVEVVALDADLVAG